MYARLNPAPHESLYDAIVRWTGDAPLHLLRVLLWTGALGALGVIIIDATRWPAGAGMVSMAALGGWGLLEHRRSGGPTRGLQTLERVVAAIALGAALVALLVGLFLLLGPAPQL